MRLEQVCEKKKLVRSDTLLFVLVVVGLLAVMFLLGYLQHTLKVISSLTQIFLFVLILAANYVIITRHLTSFRYLMTDTVLTVYRSVGKKERVAEKLLLREILFVLPYEEALHGAKGNRHALYGGARKDSVVIGHIQGSQLHWLMISPNEELFRALKHAEYECELVRNGAKQQADEGSM